MHSKSDPKLCSCHIIKIHTVLFQVLILIADETKNLEITNPQLGLVLQEFS